MNLITLILSGWALTAMVFAGLWMWNRRETNAGWVDVGWSFTLVMLVGWYALFSEGYLPRKILLLVLVGVWGLPLAWHILRRLLKEKKEDARYANLRKHWGDSANFKFFFFFQSQGIANLLLTAPILLLLRMPRDHLTGWDIAGAVIIFCAVGGERLADSQLASWKANPGNRGKTCRKGLWAYSRHPNYFFEWCHWLGYPLMGVGLWGTTLSMYWWMTLLGPVVMLFLLLRVTGIPYTEKQALKSRGDDYRKYQEEVSVFIPWKVKKRDD